MTAPVSALRLRAALEMSPVIHVKSWKLARKERVLASRLGAPHATHWPVLGIEEAKGGCYNVYTVDDLSKPVPVGYAVDADDLALGHLPDTFDDADLECTADKDCVNSLLSAIVLTHRPQRILLLDGPSMKSTRAVHRVLPDCVVEVPNPGMVPPRMRKPFVHHDMTLYERLMFEPLEHPVAAWLDYCCTMQGSRFVRPLLDLELLFASRMLTAFLGVTFCRRGRSVDEYHAEISDTVCILAYQHGYTLCETNWVAYGTVVSVFFVVGKNF